MSKQQYEGIEDKEGFCGGCGVPLTAIERGRGMDNCISCNGGLE